MTVIDRCIDCTLNVYDRDMVTLRDSLTGSGVSIVKELGSEGGATMSASRWEQAVIDDPELFREAVVKVQSDLGEGLVEFAAFLAQVGSGEMISEQENAGKTIAPGGKGLLAFFSDAKLAHEKGWLEDDLSQDNMRYFGPMSYFFDLADGVTPEAVNWYDDPTARAGFPAEMLDIDEDADWIAVTNPATDSVPKGTRNWLIKDVDVDEECEVKAWFTADNFARIFFDAELIGDMRTDLYNWKGLVEWSAIVQPGTHRFAIEVENAALTTGDNPIGALLTCWILDNAGNPDTLLVHTDPSWSAFDTTTTPIGVTVGQTVDAFIDEAVARDLPALGRLNRTYTATHDSADVPFPTDEERSYPIGMDGLELVQAIGESYDIEVTPSGDLNIYVDRGEDKSGTVSLEEGVQLLSYTPDGLPRSGTRAIVRHQAGTVVVISDEFELVVDAREDYFEDGGAATRAAGIKSAQRSLADSVRDRFTYTAVFIALAGCTPFLDFDEGDTIMAYDITGAQAPMVVTSITGDYPDAGGPWRWTVEFEEPDATS